MQLLNMVINRTKSYPRYYRYTIGDKMVNLSMRMLALIYKANRSYNKVPVLDEFIDSARMMTVLLW